MRLPAQIPDVCRLSPQIIAGKRTAAHNPKLPFRNCSSKLQQFSDSLLGAYPADEYYRPFSRLDSILPPVDLINLLAERALRIVGNDVDFLLRGILFHLLFKRLIDGGDDVRSFCQLPFEALGKCLPWS